MKVDWVSIVWISYLALAFAWLAIRKLFRD